MSLTFDTIRDLVTGRNVRISEHGYDELSDDDILVRDLLNGINSATVVGDYPTFPKGAAVLVLLFDGNNRPVHVVWGIPKGFTSPAVLVTAYRPDPAKWNEHFTGRRQ